MIVLVLVYCLGTTPDRCVERREELVPPVTMLACSIRAQNRAQEYIELHPRYHLARFRCELNHPREDPA